MGWRARQNSRRHQPTRKLLLLDLCAAALNQNGQDDDNQNTGHNPDNQSGIHIDSSLL